MYGVETGIFDENNANDIAPDDVTAGVTMSSEVTVLNMWDRQVLVAHDIQFPCDNNDDSISVRTNLASLLHMLCPYNWQKLVHDIVIAMKNSSAIEYGCCYQCTTGISRLDLLTIKYLYGYFIHIRDYW